MSLIGKTLISIPTGVDVVVENRSITVKGPKGNLQKALPRGVNVVQEENSLKVLVDGKDKQSNMMHGTYRSLISNMVKGVSDGWDKRLELVGTGYRAEVSGSELVLQVGHSHPVRIRAPEGIVFKVEKSDVIITGQDKETVGSIAATIRMVRPPDPYKGKGIKYKNEVIRRKAGKAAKTAGGAA